MPSMPSKSRGSVALILIMAMLLGLLYGCPAAPEDQPGDPAKSDEPERPFENPSFNNDSFDLSLYENTLWYYEHAPGEYQDAVFIKGKGEGGILFNLNILTGFYPFLEDLETSGMPRSSTGSYKVDFESPPYSWAPNDSIKGSLVFAGDGSSVTLVISQTGGSLRSTEGSYLMVNGADSHAVQRSVYLGQLGETPIEGPVFMPIYHLVDIDGNGVPELMVKVGSSEADFLYNILSIDRSGLRFIGSVSGGHSLITKDDDGSICRMTAHMGYEEIFRLTIVNDHISEELIFQKTLQGDDDDYYYPPAGDLAWAYVTDSRMVDSLVCADVVRDFFDLFAQGDNRGMQELVAGDLLGTDFSEHVYGMASAELTLCEYWFDAGATASDADYILMLCSFDMRPATGSVYWEGQDKATFFIALQPIDGVFKLVWFSTGP